MQHNFTGEKEKQLKMTSCNNQTSVTIHLKTEKDCITDFLLLKYKERNNKLQQHCLIAMF